MQRKELSLDWVRFVCLTRIIILCFCIKLVSAKTKNKSIVIIIKKLLIKKIKIKNNNIKILSKNTICCNCKYT